MGTPCIINRVMERWGIWPRRPAAGGHGNYANADPQLDVDHGTWLGTESKVFGDFVFDYKFDSRFGWTAVERRQRWILNPELYVSGLGWNNVSLNRIQDLLWAVYIPSMGFHFAG